MLRPLRPADLEILFAQQRDPEASALAGVPMRDRESFDARWAELLADRDVLIRVVDEGGVAGYVFAFPLHGRLCLGYWLGRDYWGRGIASKAVAEFLTEEPRRPLHATVHPGNAASIRILEKSGFARVGEQPDSIEYVLR